MIDYRKLKEYDWSEEDVDKVLNFLRIFDPDNATPETAVDFLIFHRTAIHEIGHTASDKDLEQLYTRFAEQKNKP